MNAYTEQNVNSLVIGRAEDLPYVSSLPIQFTYESTAVLSLGYFLWADAPTLLTPNRPIMNNALYYFRNISLVADLAEFDFMSNILVNPKFDTYLQSDSKAVLFREPVSMNKFYDQFDYRLFWHPGQGSDVLYAAFSSGSIFQGPGMIGKTTITLKAIISATEISDENYIETFSRKYPKSTAVQGANL